MACINQKASFMHPFMFRVLARLVLVASLWGAGLAMAQTEPSMNQIYATAQAGKLDAAQLMVQQVLIAHPRSAKAFFVQAELYARQGQLDLARESLATADQLAPGLPFAKSESVQALRTQLAAKHQAPSTRSSLASDAGQLAAQPSASAWVLPLLLAAAVMLGGYLIFRRRVPQPRGQAPAAVDPGGLKAAQAWGLGGGVPPSSTPYPPSAYPQSYPPSAGTGLGGRIMGGVATGLAVGAGVMAAEAIGRQVMGDHNATVPQTLQPDNSRYEPLAENADLGGNNFGISDTAWDDDAGGDVGGGDWDS